MKEHPFLPLFIVVPTLISLLMVPPLPVEAGCLPYAVNQGEEYQPCNLLNKKATWSISWPQCSLSPLHNASIEIEGSGWCAVGNVCCDATPRTTECWPLFNQPIQQNGLWKVVVNNRTTNSKQTTCNGNCATATTVTCFTISSPSFEMPHEGGENCDHDCTLEMCEAGCAWDCDSDQCMGSGCASPILIDIAGDGFNLTSAGGGVQFDLNTDGVKEIIAWTTATSDDSWLVLDRNNNGNIDNGAELFGNYTPQAATTLKNGFIALTEYDKRTNGGNADGIITASDAVFSSLRLWQDSNHNGISESSELRSLNGAGLTIIELDYKTSRKTDEYGNRFRYRAKVKDTQGTQLGRWAWDVFLVEP